jgi:uncharacterized spore protein YtfJ
MDNEKKIQSILKTVEGELKVWLQDEPMIKDPIEYEKRLLQMALRFGQNVMQEGNGKKPKDRNAKKKFLPYLEKFL